MKEYLWSSTLRMIFPTSVTYASSIMIAMLRLSVYIHVYMFNYFKGPEQ